MASWHYQVMKKEFIWPSGRKEDSYGLHEYYCIEGEPAWTEDPIIADSSVKELKETLQRMLRDIDRHGVISYEG